MLKHHLLIAYRGFLRDKSSFVINIIGLSTGLACALLIYVWVVSEASMDQFHERGDGLYQVMSNFHQPQGISTGGSTPIRLATALEADFPEVTLTTLINRRYYPTGNIESGEKTFTAQRIFTDENFFDVFSFELIQGTSEYVLDDISNIVISDKLAEKLFGSLDDVIGKTVTWSNTYFEGEFQISGVFISPPTNSTYQFDAVLHYEWIIRGDPPSGQWNASAAENFVVLREGASPSAFNDKIDTFLWSKIPGDTSQRLFVEKFSDRYLYNKYENGIQAGGRIAYVRIFSAIGIFILLIACINFMNLTTAQASKKLKEIGVKKAIGAYRSTLIRQFLTASTLLVIIAFGLSLILAYLVFPHFQQISGKEIQLTLGPGAIALAIFFIGITGLLAGSYPAFFLSRFNAITVLKGRSITFGGEQSIRNGLVVFQFALSVIFIVSVVVMSQQMDYLQTKNLGFDRDNIVSFERPRYDENPDAFIHALSQLNGVESAASMYSSILSGWDAQSGYSWTGESSERDWIFKAPQVGYGAIKTLGMSFISGRDFSPKFQDDHTKIVINESAARKMGLENPVGTIIQYGTAYREIIGVVNDFHYGSLHREIEPLIFRFPDWGWGTNTIVRLKQVNQKETLQQIAKLYDQFHAEQAEPLQFTFLDDDYQALYDSEQRVALLSRYFSLFAIIVSCLGLFGLASFTTEQKTKEIGVRKTLGASNWRIVQLLTTNFTKTVAAGITIALPFSYLIAQHWLDGFAYKIDLTWPLFTGSALLTLLLAWMVISIKTFRAASINPVVCLQYE